MTRRRLCAIPVLLVATWLVLLNRLAPPPRPMDGAEPSITDRARIINGDDRARVQDTTVLPWRTIGQIRGWWGSQGFTGTGVLVAPDQVLTAAHCVYRADFGGWANSVEFIPARNGQAQPFGKAMGVRFALPRRYAERQSEADDIVLMTLDRAIGNQTGWLPVAADLQPLSVTLNWSLQTAGYPSDKPSGEMYAASGSVMSSTKASSGIWEIDLDAIFGQSGSPIWISDPAGGQATVVAVLVAELDSGRANIAVPVSADMLAQFQAVSTAEGMLPADDSSIFVGEPGSAGIPLATLPIGTCGAGIVPIMAISVLCLAGLRSRFARLV